MIALRHWHSESSNESISADPDDESRLSKDEFPVDNECQKHQWTIGVIDVVNDLVLCECAICHKQHEIRGLFDNN